ncbi:MAG: ABC transporter substrate-binding protein [Syntrophales bacterium]
MSVRSLLILAILATLAPHPARGAELRHLSFLPHWLPQAQFAGYYMAREKGLYTKQGINLTILRGGPERPAADALARGKVDFATTFLSAAVQQRDRGVRLVNIAQVVQRSGFILVTKKTSGINSPADLNGKKVGLWPDFRLQPLAFFRKYGVEVRPVDQGATMTLLLRGGVAAASAMWYNEYHTLLNAGINPDELKPFFFDRHGLNFPEDGIYCLEETLRRNADLCHGFVRASFAGWEYAFAHPEETLDVVMEHVRRANVGTNRTHQRWMLARMKDLIFPPGNASVPGLLNREDYHRVTAELKQNGLIRAIPPYGAIYADCTTPR